MFNVKMESAATCRGCLSTDRKLSPLTNNKTYFNLLTDKQKQEGLTESEVLLCWECRAALNRMQLFQAQAQKACVVLELSLDKAVSVRSLSTLTTCHKDSYDAIFYEIEDKETPIKKEKLSFESDDETNEDYCNDNDDSDHLELNLEAVTMPDALNPLGILKNEQQIEKIDNDTINTKIKVKRLVASKTKPRHTIMNRPPSSRIKKIQWKKIMSDKKLKNKMMAEKRLKKKIMTEKWQNKIEEVKIKVIHKDLETTEKKPFKTAPRQVQFREGIRKSKRLSGIEVEEIENSNEHYVGTKNTVELIKEDVSDNDICGNKYVDSSNLNENEINNEEVKVNETENVSGNGGRDNVHTDGSDDEASDEGLEQPEENEKEENYNLIPKNFRKTIVEYDRHVELDTYFTKLELSEDETKAALEREPKYITKDLPHDCGYCGVCFQLKRTLEDHIKHNHTQHRKDIKRVGLHVYYRDSMYRCHHCAVVLRRHKTAAHMKYAHRVRYHCKHCNMDFWNKPDCKQHVLTNHSRFDCDLCDESRPSFKMLEKHKRHQHDADARKPKSTSNPVQCEECGKELHSTWYLIAHQETCHPRDGSDPRFHCAPCNRTLRSERHYQWHMKHAKEHRSPRKVTREVCVFCGKVCSSKSMRGHYVRFHNQKTNFQCKTCGMYFDERSKLRHHVNYVHLKVPRPKNRLCTICGRAFSTNIILTHHMRTHTGERPYKCSLCPAAFAQPYPLKKHSETQHGRRDTTRATAPHTHSDVHSQSLVQVPVEPRSHDEVIIEWPVQDEVIIETQNQDTEMSA